MRKTMLAAGVLGLMALAPLSSAQAGQVGISVGVDLFQQAKVVGCPRIWPPAPGCGGHSGDHPQPPDPYGGGNYQQAPDPYGQPPGYNPDGPVQVYGDYMSCRDGGYMLRRMGFRHVEPYRCGDYSYRYTAWWHGDPVRVRVRAEDGKILWVLPR